MIAHGKWKDGRVIVEEAVDWPDGCEVEVRPLIDRELANDERQPNDPQDIERWIAEFQSIPPLEMTVEEQVAWQAARQAQREFELKTFNQRADHLQQVGNTGACLRNSGALAVPCRSST